MINVKSENSLYHYCKLSTALEFILPDRQLRLNPLLKTNDPREYKNFVFMQENVPGTNTNEFNELNSEICKILREDCKTLCFSHDNYPFSGYEYSRMWALYGENHKGVCLHIDKEEFIKENDKINPELLRKINYHKIDITKSPVHPAIDVEKMNSLGKQKYIKEVFLQENTDHLYFTKFSEWESEQETRLIHFDKSNEYVYCSINNSLKNIYLGVEFHDAYIPAINGLFPDVDIYRLKFSGLRLHPFKIEN